jgi:phosphoketolase
MSMMYGQSRMYTPTEANGVLAIERTYLGEKTLTFINTTKEAKRIYLEPKTTTSLLVGQAEIIDNAVTIAPEKSAAFDIQIN